MKNNLLYLALVAILSTTMLTRVHKLKTNIEKDISSINDGIVGHIQANSLTYTNTKNLNFKNILFIEVITNSIDLNKISSLSKAIFSDISIKEKLLFKDYSRLDRIFSNDNLVEHLEFNNAKLFKVLEIGYLIKLKTLIINSSNLEEIELPEIEKILFIQLNDLKELKSINFPPNINNLILNRINVQKLEIFKNVKQIDSLEIIDNLHKDFVVIPEQINIKKLTFGCKVDITKLKNIDKLILIAEKHALLKSNIDKLSISTNHNILDLSAVQNLKEVYIDFNQVSESNNFELIIAHNLNSVILYFTNLNDKIKIFTLTGNFSDLPIISIKNSFHQVSYIFNSTNHEFNQSYNNFIQNPEMYRLLLTYNQYLQTTKLKTANCAICKNKFKQGEVLVQNSCTHVFHEKCSMDYTNNNKCFHGCKIDKYTPMILKNVREDIISYDKLNEIHTANPYGLNNS